MGTNLGLGKKKNLQIPQRWLSITWVHSQENVKRKKKKYAKMFSWDLTSYQGNWGSIIAENIKSKQIKTWFF